MVIKNYLSLIKFSHTIFALPFAIIGFVIGVTDVLEFNIYYNSGPGFLSRALSYRSGEFFLLKIFLLVLVCMVFARSAAMAFNRYLDRAYDAKNPRTAIREVPSGIISAKNALLFTIISSLLFVVATFFINRICFYLSPVALFIILFYSYTKRFTPLCHLVLGVGLSLAPIGAYLAVTGHFSVLPVLFSFVVLCWVSGFDIIYAMQDEGFDRENNLYSIPVMAGKKRALDISILLHVISAALVIFAGYYGNFGLWYWVGTLIFCSMLIYQHAIVSPTDLSRVNISFMTANGIASVVFACFVLLDIIF